MGDLFLRIRIEALERNLRDVRQLVNVVGARSDSIRRLNSLLVAPGANATLNLRRAKSAVDAISRLNDYPDIADLFSDYGLSEHLATAARSLTNLEQTLQEAQQETRKLVADIRETDALLNREHVKTIFNAGPALNLLTQTIQLRTALGTDEAAAPAAVDGDAAAPAWAKYRELVGGPDQLSLFQQYVDVAAGLSLRGMGMDEHFCAMADWLSDYWTTVVDLPYMFAIPARTEPSTIPSIIRLGFPEWTIWALPLFAHEFGRILVEKDAELQALAERLAAAPSAVPKQLGPDAGAAETARRAREARIRTYLADAFATYVMGPAYACACLLLKLDPLSVGRAEDQAWDLVRAEVVVGTLRHMAPKLQGNLTDTIDKLQLSWNDAVAHLAPPAVSEGERRLVEPVVSSLVQALEVIELRNQTHIRFDDNAFADAKRRAVGFFPDPPAEGADPDLEAVTMVQVLNAAWYRRLQRPDSAPDIARQVRDHIWPRLKPPTRGGESTSHTPPSDAIRP
ncbi:MAG: hypothetical protein JWQ45_3265 [Blastococcus sp.]|jgi:hypothetical protein|nr:hypothetical protein [Blastococcus sp.]